MLKTAFYFCSDIITNWRKNWPRWSRQVTLTATCSRWPFRTVPFPAVARLQQQRAVQLLYRPHPHPHPCLTNLPTAPHPRWWTWIWTTQMRFQMTDFSAKCWSIKTILLILQIQVHRIQAARRTTTRPTTSTPRFCSCSWRRPLLRSYMCQLSSKKCRCCKLLFWWHLCVWYTFVM